MEEESYFITCFVFVDCFFPQRLCFLSLTRSNTQILVASNTYGVLGGARSRVGLVWWLRDSITFAMIKGTTTHPPTASLSSLVLHRVLFFFFTFFSHSKESFNETSNKRKKKQTKIRERVFGHQNGDTHTGSQRREEERLQAVCGVRITRSSCVLRWRA